MARSETQGRSSVRVLNFLAWVLLAAGAVTYVVAKVDFFSGFQVVSHHEYLWAIMLLIAVLLWLLGKLARRLEQ